MPPAGQGDKEPDRGEREGGRLVGARMCVNSTGGSDGDGALQRGCGMERD